MKKLLFVLPLVAGASWAGTTYYSGSQSESAYQRLIADLNELDFLEFKADSYESGFVNSMAYTEVRIVGQDPSESPLFQLQHVIDHSPFGVDSQGFRVGKSSVVTTFVIDDTDAELASMFNGQDPVVLHSRIDASGNASNELTLANIQYQDDELVLDFDGAKLDIQTSATGRILGTGYIGELNANKPQYSGSAFIAESPINFDLQRLGNYLYDGNVSWVLPVARAESEMWGGEFSLDTLQLKSKFNVKHGKVSELSELSLAKINAPANFPMQLPVNAFNWTIGFDNLDAIAYESLGSSYDKMVDMAIEQTRIVNALSGDNNDIEIARNEQKFDTAAEQFAIEYVESLVALFGPGAKFHSALQLKNDSGKADMKVDVSYVGESLADGQWRSKTPRDILSAITVDANLDADAAAINATPAAMLMMSPPASEYIINTGNSYVSKFKVEDLLVYLNDDPLDLFSMIDANPELDIPLGQLVMNEFDQY